MSRTCLVISHAACKGHAPENTLAGIRAALKLRAQAIEIDVRPSRDGVPVLMHDATVDRTTDGAGAVRDFTADQLRRLDAGDGEHVPTLAEVLGTVAGDVPLFVEIKEPGVETAVLRDLERARTHEGTMVWSFSQQAVATTKQLAPRLSCSLLIGVLPQEARERFFADALRIQADAVSVHHTQVDRALVEQAHGHDLRCYAWTADDPEEIARLREIGVDGIVTNYPDVAWEVLRARRRP